MNDSQRPDRYDDDGDYDDEGNWVSNQNDEPLEEPDEPYVNYSEDDEPLDEPPAPAAHRALAYLHLVCHPAPRPSVRAQTMTSLMLYGGARVLRRAKEADHLN